MKWVWNADKNRANLRKHGLDFETAQRVFDEPLASTRLDDWTGEERWQTVGMVGPAIIFVVHAGPINMEGEDIGRIITARLASRLERKAYEEGGF
jgi:uncharacterized protein